MKPSDPIAPTVQAASEPSGSQQRVVSLPDKLSGVRTVRCHGVVWRYELYDARSKKVLKRSVELDRLYSWAAINGWTVAG